MDIYICVILFFGNRVSHCTSVWSETCGNHLASASWMLGSHACITPSGCNTGGKAKIALSSPWTDAGGAAADEERQATPWPRTDWLVYIISWQSGGGRRCTAEQSLRPRVPAHRRLRQEGCHRCKASLGHSMKLSQNNHERIYTIIPKPLQWQPGWKLTESWLSEWPQDQQYEHDTQTRPHPGAKTLGGTRQFAF